MITPQQKVSALTQWFQSGKAPLLKEVLNNPIVREALKFIEGHAEPNDAILPSLVKDYGVNAPMVISIIHSTQAGERRMLRVLERLSQAPPENIEHAANQEPFAYIDEKYLEPK